LLPKGGRQREYDYVNLKAVSIADLLIADPLTRGRAVASVLLTLQRRVLDLVDDARLRGRLSGDNEESSGE
jgi:hypothetical protein